MGIMTSPPYLQVSIHAPREGCDLAMPQAPSWDEVVSIHAPREGCDAPIIMATKQYIGFNPRTP